MTDTSEDDISRPPFRRNRSPGYEKARNGQMRGGCGETRTHHHSLSLPFTAGLRMLLSKGLDLVMWVEVGRTDVLISCLRC